MKASGTNARASYPDCVCDARQITRKKIRDDMKQKRTFQPESASFEVKAIARLENEQTYKGKI